MGWDGIASGRAAISFTSSMFLLILFPRNHNHNRNHDPKYVLQRDTAGNIIVVFIPSGSATRCMKGPRIL